MTVGRIPSVEGGIQPTIFDAKADLLTATANDTPARLAVGANNTTLVADSTAATGLKWVGFRGCSVYAASQTIATATLTAITFDFENFDTDNFHSNVTNTSRITIPTGLGGKYLVNYAQRWDPSAAGTREANIYKNGVQLTTQSLTASSTYATGAKSVIIDLAAGDYIELYVAQSSGSNLVFYPRNEELPFQVQYLGA